LFFVNPAGHAFNCDAGDSCEPESAKLVQQRALNFFARSLR